MHNNNKDSKRPPIQPRHALTLDVEKYQKMLDAPEVSGAQREEMIKALWSIITAFVDLGFDVQSAKNTCGQGAETVAEPCSDADNLLYCSPDLPELFAHSAESQKGARHD